MTRPEIAQAIRGEGTVIVGGWNYAARDALVKQFQGWVKREYDIDVQLQYIAEAAPATYLQNLDAARKADRAAPYDVIAVEENYFLDAQRGDAAEKMLPSDLLSNALRVEAAPLHDPYAVPFQSSATIAPIFHNDAVGAWFHDWKDLADARLKRRITLPEAGDVIAGAFLIGVAGSLSKDYENPQQMSEAIDFVCTQIYPNALKTTSNFSEMQELLRGERIDVAVAWNLLARLEGFSGADGTQDIVFHPMSSGQPAINGYAWIPKGAPHPVLAQLFINWRLSDQGQLPGDAWDISKAAWGEYHEGLLGASYEAAIPEWTKENYFQVYPSVADMKNLYTPIDWAYYAAHEAEWMEQYRKCVE
jgi:spermidine/putrescine-binding protein